MIVSIIGLEYRNIVFYRFYRYNRCQVTPTYLIGYQYQISEINSGSNRTLQFRGNGYRISRFQRSLVISTFDYYEIIDVKFHDHYGY